MTARALSRALLAWAIATAIACALVHRLFALDVDESRPRAVVASVWSAGKMVERAVLSRDDESDARLDAAMASHPGATIVHERIVAEGPVVARPEAALALSFVPGRDGVSASLGDRTAYLTPDELLSRQAYDKGINVPSIQLQAGLDVPLAIALLSERLGVLPSELLDRARLRRIRVQRVVVGAPPQRRITPDSMTNEDVRGAVLAAAHFLARGVDAQGRFRYMVDAPTNKTLPGYDWPRHAGATYFLAQAAALSGDPQITHACLRSAAYLRDKATLRCGKASCIGDGDSVDVGSTALAVLAFVEIARTRIDASYAGTVTAFTEFLRSQQRADGEFMHVFDRRAGRPVDVQLLYYSGEATLALSRAYGVSDDARDLDAATRGLAHLVGPAWSFFGSRYYYGEEHWTCQAMDDLWDRVPDPDALDFCLRWQRYGRALQYGAADTEFDAEGAYGFGPLTTPRLTPVGSRCEAGIATLDAARRADTPEGEKRALELQLRKSLALLLRHQLRPGMRHLYADPAAVEGAMPGSEVDWQLRIDYAQHSGSAMIRWLELQGQGKR